MVGACLSSHPEVERHCVIFVLRHLKFSRSINPIDQLKEIKPAASNIFETAVGIICGRSFCQNFRYFSRSAIRGLSCNQ